jgi:hypothetical protein
MNLKTKARVDDLIKIGLSFNCGYKSLTKDDINFHWVDLTCMSDEEFNREFRCIVCELKDREKDTEFKTKLDLDMRKDIEEMLVDKKIKNFQYISTEGYYTITLEDNSKFCFRFMSDLV